MAERRAPAHGGRRPQPSDLPVLLAVVNSAAFLLVDPPVGDLWAARARQSAARHGVGLHYWFSWFGGTVPGHYSVLEPMLTRWVSTEVLGAVAAVLLVGLTQLLVRGSHHPLAATWLALAAVVLDLWSGRIPFAVGSVLMLAGLLLVRANRGVGAAAVTVVTALVSPVAAAFTALGVCGLVLHDRARRRAALLVIAAAAVPLGAVGLYFGSPGPEGFDPTQAAFALAAIAVLFLARPAPYVRTVLLLSLPVWLVAVAVPNGLGGNFERFTWIVLPVAVVATARAPRRLAATVGALAVTCSAVGTAKDLYVASRPQSQRGYYAALIRQLDARPDLLGHRIEVVPDGTHLAADLLLGHAYLARGYETQSDNQYARVLNDGPLDAARYRRWLDDNAVAYVLLDHTTTTPSAESTLVRLHRPAYLRQTWTDGHWRLFAVTRPVPIAPAPARVVAAAQARLTVVVSRPARVQLRVRWSRFLTVRSTDGGRARLAAAAHCGWTVLTVQRPGRFVLGG